MQAMKDLFPDGAIQMKKFVMDFEIAIWLSIRKVFGLSVKLRECNFHWCQAVFGKITNLGLRITHLLPEISCV